MIGPTCATVLAAQAPALFAQLNPKGLQSLQDMVEHLIEGFDHVEAVHDTDAWALMAEDALDILYRLGLTFDRPGFVKLVCRKQHDYGHENILKFGVHGVIVRTWDKIARLQNLLGRSSAAANEPLADTLIDIVGYSVIGIMLEKNWFTLPLVADLPPGGF
jgi:hypothetical protein